LAEDAVSRGERLLLGNLGDLRQLLGGQGAEQIDRLEKEDLLDGRDHAMALGAPCWRMRRTVCATEVAGSSASGASSRGASPGMARATASAAASRSGADEERSAICSGAARLASEKGASSTQRVVQAATQSPDSPEMSPEARSEGGRWSARTTSPRRFTSSREASTSRFHGAGRGLSSPTMAVPRWAAVSARRLSATTSRLTSGKSTS